MFRSSSNTIAQDDRDLTIAEATAGADSQQSLDNFSIRSRFTTALRSIFPSKSSDEAQETERGQSLITSNLGIADKLSPELRRHFNVLQELLELYYAEKHPGEEAPDLTTLSFLGFQSERNDLMYWMTEQIAASEVSKVSKQQVAAMFEAKQFIRPHEKELWGINIY